VREREREVEVKEGREERESKLSQLECTYQPDRSSRLTSGQRVAMDSGLVAFQSCL